MTRGSFRNGWGVWTLTAIVAGAFGLTVMGGCAGFATYPPSSGQMAADDPNGRIVERAMGTALRRAINDHPPTSAMLPAGAGTAERPERIAVNLFPGMTSVNAERVAEKAGEGVVPLWEGSADLPTYHVSRLWLRGSRASADVHHPVITRAGTRTTRMVTYDMRGGLTGFRIERTREWAVGAFEPPEPFGYTPSVILEAEAAAEAERQAAERAAAREAARREREAQRQAEREASEQERQRRGEPQSEQQPEPEPEPEPTPDPVSSNGR